MSQHYFSAGKYEVLAGWDRPLQCFFLVINKTSEDEPIYSNLNDPGAGVKKQESGHFQEVLSRMNLSAPPGFWAAIEADRDYNVGNRVRFWSMET